MGRRVEVLHIVGGALLLTMLTTIGTTTMLLGHGHTIDDQGQGQVSSTNLQGPLGCSIGNSS